MNTFRTPLLLAGCDSDTIQPAAPARVPHTPETTTVALAALSALQAEEPSSLARNTSAALRDAILHRAVDHHIARLPSNALDTWETVVQQLLDNTNFEDFEQHLTMLLDATAEEPDFAAPTWNAVVAWATAPGCDSEMACDAINTLERCWHPDAPTQWHQNAIAWGVGSGKFGVLQTLLSTDLPLAEELPGGFTPLTAYIEYDVEGGALRLLEGCPAEALQKDGEGRDPLAMAVTARKDRIAAAIARRYQALGLVPQDSNALGVALALNMDTTIDALIDAGACLAAPDLPAHETDLFHLVAKSDRVARRAIRSALADPAIGTRRARKLLVTCGKEYLLDRNADAFRHLLTSDIPKSIADDLLCWAIYHQNAPAVRLCREAGADSDARSLNVFCPITYAGFAGASDAVLDALDGLTSEVDRHADEVIERKILAHVWDLSGSTPIGDTNAALTGCFPQHFYQPLMDAITAVIGGTGARPDHTSILAEVHEMLEALSLQPTNELAAAAIQTKAPCIVQMGGYRHAVAGLFYNDKYYLCNIGSHSTTPVEVFDLPAEAVTEELLDSISAVKTQRLSTAMAYLRAFPSNKGHGPDEAATKRLDSIWFGKRKQAVGNCSLESLVTAIKLYIIERLVPAGLPGGQRSQRLRQARRLANSIRQTLMVQTLEQYVHSHSITAHPELVATELLRRVREVAADKPARFWSAEQQDALARCGVHLLRAPGTLVDLAGRTTTGGGAPSHRAPPPPASTRLNARDLRLLEEATRRKHNPQPWMRSKKSMKRANQRHTSKGGKGGHRSSR